MYIDVVVTENCTTRLDLFACELSTTVCCDGDCTLCVLYVLYVLYEGQVLWPVSSIERSTTCFNRATCCKLLSQPFHIV